MSLQVKIKDNTITIIHTDDKGRTVTTALPYNELLEALKLA